MDKNPFFRGLNKIFHSSFISACVRRDQVNRCARARIISIRHPRCYFPCRKFRGTLRREQLSVLFGTNRGRLNFHCKFHSIWFFSYVTIRLDEPPPFDLSSIYATVDEAALSNVPNDNIFVKLVIDRFVKNCTTILFIEIVRNVFFEIEVSFSWLSYLNIFFLNYFVVLIIFRCV